VRCVIFRLLLSSTTEGSPVSDWALGGSAQITFDQVNAEENTCQAGTYAANSSWRSWPIRKSLPYTA
jgi:hypothetical protein